MSAPPPSPSRSNAGGARADVGGGVSGRDLVLQAVDLADLIGQSVKLKRAGREYVGLCPFHSEKTPSFHVVPHKGFYHCFGCKASGNAIDFVMNRDRVEFIDALKLLAEQYNVDLPRRRDDPDADRRAAVFEVLSAAAAHFARNLRAPAGRAAVDYLKDRGFTGEVARDFQLGYAAGNLLDDPAIQKLVKRHGEGVLAAADLVRRSDGGRVYESFRERLMFPIRDDRGRTIAFGGRVLPGGDHPAKYLNSKEIDVFHKSRVAYGLDRAKDAITRSRTVAVVEGYTDVVMLHQHGAANVVSVLGTALTEEHVKLLRRFADKVVLIFDADTAGAGATRRGIELFLTQPVDIGIVTLPDGLDPDEFVKSRGGEAFGELLGKAESPLEYHWRGMMRSTADSLTARERELGTFLDLIAKARRAGTMPAERWGPAVTRVARVTGLSAAEVERRVNELAGTAARAERPAERVPKRAYIPQEQWAKGVRPMARVEADRSRVRSADEKAERALLGGLMLRPEVWEAAQRHVGPEDVATPGLHELAGRLWEHLRHEGELEFAAWHATLGPLASLASEVAAEANVAEDLESTMNEAAGHLARRRERSAERELRRRLGTGDDAEAEALRQLADRSRAPDPRRGL